MTRSEIAVAVTPGSAKRLAPFVSEVSSEEEEVQMTRCALPAKAPPPAPAPSPALAPALAPANTFWAQVWQHGQRFVKIILALWLFDIIIKLARTCNNSLLVEMLSKTMVTEAGICMKALVTHHDDIFAFLLSDCAPALAGKALSMRYTKWIMKSFQVRARKHLSLFFGSVPISSLHKATRLSASTLPCFCSRLVQATTAAKAVQPPASATRTGRADSTGCFEGNTPPPAISEAHSTIIDTHY